MRIFIKPSNVQWTKITFGSKHPYEMQVYSRVYGGPINKKKDCNWEGLRGMGMRRPNLT